MDWLVDYTMHLTVDRRTMAATAFVTRSEEKGERWVSDHCFGPFDTPLLVGLWLARALDRDGVPMTR